MPNRRARNDANTSANIVHVLPGVERTIRRGVILHNAPESGFTAGCVVIPLAGSPTEVSNPEGYLGATGAVRPPAAATTLPIAVIDIAPLEGWDLTTEYRTGDQVTAIYAKTGAQFNVRVPSDANIVQNQFLTYAIDGSGMVIPGTESNAIGIAHEDAVVNDPALPTWCIMEVL